MKMKKTMILSMIVVLCLTFSNIAYAAPEVTTGQIELQTVLEGTIEALQIKASLPSKITFSINPNKAANYTSTPSADTAFNTASFTVSNDSQAPMDFRIVNIEGDSVVAADKYTDEEWKNLHTEDTKSNMRSAL